MPVKIKIQLGFILLLIIVALSLISSQNANPDSPTLYSLKRIQEKIFMRLQSKPQDKLDYMKALLNKRLAELDSQVKRESYNYILPSSSRYSSQAGQITETIAENSMKDQIDDVKNQFINHLNSLRQIYITYPKNTENIEYKYIEDDINYLKIYLDKLG